MLARLVRDDPLGLRARIALRLGQLALLCDIERVLLTAQVLCALDAPDWRGEPALSIWLDTQVEEALALVQAEDEAEDTPLDLLQSFAGPLALDARAFATACGQFNRLSFDQREAFWALVLDAGRADGLARARGLSLSELARRARAGLRLFRPVATGLASNPASAAGTRERVSP